MNRTSQAYRANGNPPQPRQPYEIRRIGGGDELAVDLDEMLLDLRIDSSDENDTVLRLIRGMADYFEARTGWRLTPVSYELLVGACGRQLTVERGPFRSLDGVWYWDSEELEWVAVDLAETRVIERGREFDIIFTQAAADLFPAPTAIRPQQIRVQFSAGFDPPDQTETTIGGLPEDGMVVALKALVAVAYENREAGSAAGSWAGADPAKDFLLQRYRKFW